MAVDVEDQQFESDVVEKSHSVPVLVDFWAEWCGPCRMLGPVLNKLEEEYAGRFVLAKVNTDHAPATAARFQVSGIPAVKLFHKGTVVDQFVGAFPEPQVRRFLDTNLPDPRLQEIRAGKESSPVAAAEAVLAEGLSGKDASAILWRGFLEALAAGKEVAGGAIRFLAAIPELGDSLSDARNAILPALERAQAASGPSLEPFVRLLGSDPRSVLETLVSQVSAAQGDARSRFREDLIAAFHLLGNQGPLVDEYRRKLASALF